MENISKIIQERRSIYPKEYTGQLLSDDIVRELLINANFAPNHKSNYPWRFKVMKGESLIQWLDFAADLYKKENAGDRFKPEKYDKILFNKNKISHAIAIVCHREEESKTILNEDICAVAAAVQNMYLSLSAHEHAGGYWSTGLGTYSADMKQYFGLAEGDLLLGYFIIGHLEVKRTSGARKNIDNFVDWL